MTFTLIMPAAGSGVRLGATVPKALVELAGLPLFVRAARPFLSHPGCRYVVIAAPAESVEIVRDWMSREFSTSLARVVAGGDNRQESVNKALEQSPDSNPLIVVHDAARPLVTTDVLDRVLEGMDERFAAVVPAVPVSDTIKRGAGDPTTVVNTIDREGLFSIQTPQAVRRDHLKRAHALATEQQVVCSDDAGLIEFFGLGAVRIVAGSPDNFKITSPADLLRAAELIRRRL